MSIVQDVLHRAIQERIDRSRHIQTDILAAVARIQEYEKIGDQNNTELEELLDALECETDHLERASA